MKLFIFVYNKDYKVEMYVYLTLSQWSILYIPKNKNARFTNEIYVQNKMKYTYHRVIG